MIIAQHRRKVCLMFHWSAHAPHIQSLFRPWRSGDGYSAPTIAAAETALDLHFPLLLHSFYQAWGNRTDLTRQVQTLLAPSDLFVQSDALIFCVENQAVWYWGIPCAVLHEDDPPIVTARTEKPELIWQPSHDHLSDFLDYLSYSHALAGGALHGAYAQEGMDESQAQLLRQHYAVQPLPSYPQGRVPDPKLRPWSLFVGKGFVIEGGVQITAAARNTALLEEIKDVLHIAWGHRW
jgi:hypothetical protein